MGWNVQLIRCEFGILGRSETMQYWHTRLIIDTQYWGTSIHQKKENSRVTCYAFFFFFFRIQTQFRVRSDAVLAYEVDY